MDYVEFHELGSLHIDFEEPSGSFSLFLFLFKENTNCSECTVWVTAHVGPDPLLDGWAGKLMTLHLFCKIRIKTPLYSKIIVNIRIHICKCLCSTWLITKLSLAGRISTVFTATSQGRIIHYCPLSLGLFMGLALFNDTEVEKMHHLHGEVFSLFFLTWWLAISN